MASPPAPATAISDSPSATAAASRGISRLLEGPPATAELLGVSTRGAWLQVGDHVMVLSDAGPTRLPNGVTVGGSDWPLPQLGAHLSVGLGELAIGENHVTVVRWWDPTPSLPVLNRQAFATSALVAAHLLQCPGYDVLENALSGGIGFAIRDSLLDLLGAGPGLTPEGDDVLVGVLAGLSLLGPAMGAVWARDLLCRIESILAVEAPFRTTSLSVALLRHAAAGEVASPVGGFLQALAGQRDLVDAVAELREMGGTSGAATACGVLVAGRVLIEGDVDGR